MSFFDNFDFSFLARKKQERSEADAFFMQKLVGQGVQGPPTPEQVQFGRNDLGVEMVSPVDPSTMQETTPGKFKQVPSLSAERGGAQAPLPGQSIAPGQDEGFLANLVDPGVTLTEAPTAAAMGAKLAAGAGVKAAGVVAAATRDAVANITAGLSDVARVGVRALANQRGSVPLDPGNLLPNEMGKGNNARLGKTPGPDAPKFEEATKVAKDGQPIPVYHGTGQVFDAFDPKAATQNGKSLGQGIYFTESAESASKYASMGETPNVRQVFLDIRKPFDMSKAAKPELAGKMANDIQASGKVGDAELVGRLRSATTNEEMYHALTDIAGPERANRILKAYGFDGIKDQSTWVAFDATQIKNAIGAKTAKAAMQAEVHNPVDVAFDAVNDVNDVKTAVMNVAAQLGKQKKKDITLAPGAKPLPDPFVDSIAQTLGLSHDDVLGRLRGAGLDVEHIRAYGMLYAKAKTNLEQVAEAVDAGYLPEKDMFDAFGRFKLFHGAVFGAGTELGQSLRMFQADDFKNTKAFATDLMGQLSELQGAVPNGMALAKMVKTAGSNAVIRTSISASELGNDMFKELLYFSLLSNPSTNIVNVASGSTLTPTLSIAQRYLQEKFGAGYVKQGETAAMITAFNQAWLNGVRSVMQSAKDEGWWATIRAAKNVEGFGSDTGRAVGPAITGKNVGQVAGAMAKRMTPEFMADPKDVDLAFRSMFGDTLLGRITDGVGELVHYPLAMLRVGDRFSKSINFDMEARAQAIRGAFLNTGETDPAAIKAGIDKALIAPGLGVRESAEKLAAVNTFTNDLVHGVPGILNHPVAKTFIPFYQAPLNILKYNLAHTPFAPIMSEVRTELAAGGLRAEAAKTRIAMGTAFMGGIAALAKTDVITITGRGPDNPNTRAVWLKDNIPYSITVKNPVSGKSTQIGLNRIEPYGTWFGLTADMVNMSGDVDPKDAGEVAAAMAASMSRNFTNKTFAYSAFELLDLLNVKNYEDADSLDQRIADWAAKRTAGFIPAISGTGATKAVDPVLRDVQVHGDAAATLVNRVKSRTPGWSKDLPAMLDLYGDPIVTEGGWATALFSPFKLKSIEHDPIVKEIVRVKTNFPRVPNVLDGVALSPEEHHALSLAFGKADFGDGNMQQQLAKMIASPDYVNAPTDAFRAKLLEGVGRARLGSAKGLLLEDTRFDVMDRMYGSKMKTVDELMGPQTESPSITFTGNPLFK